MQESIKIKGHRIAVISDTHGLLRPEVTGWLKSCEAIMHAGDIGKPEVIEQLKDICLTYAVRGNVDKEWAKDIPEELKVSVFGFQIYMVHNKKQIKQDRLSGVDLVIYGHSHKYEARREGGCYFLNPGSCGPRRFYQPVTMMLLALYPETHHLEVEKIDCLPMLAQKEETMKLPEKNMDKLIRKIMKEVDAGVSVDDIAVRNGLGRELAEQICRIYLTHPGVSVDGILARMELRAMEKKI